MKKTKLEETFNLPPIDSVKDAEQFAEEETGIELNQMHELMARADKIDAALPQVSGLDTADKDFDDYAKKAVDAFEDLVDLSKNVEDRHISDIAQAASSMLTNAINAKTNKVNKKLEMVKQQMAKAKLEHEKEKLEYLKARHLKNGEDDRDEIETEGTVVATRADIIRDLLEEVKNEKD